MFVSLNFYSLVAVDSSDAKAIVWTKYLMLCPVASMLKQGKEVLKRKGDSKVGKAARSKAWVLATNGGAGVGELDGRRRRALAGQAVNFHRVALDMKLHAVDIKRIAAKRRKQVATLLWRSRGRGGGDWSRGGSRHLLTVHSRHHLTDATLPNPSLNPHVAALPPASSPAVLGHPVVQATYLVSAPANQYSCSRPP